MVPLQFGKGQRHELPRVEAKQASHCRLFVLLDWPQRCDQDRNAARPRPAADQ